MRAFIYCALSIVAGAVFSIVSQVESAPVPEASCCAMVCPCDGDPALCICGDDCHCPDCGK